MNELHVGLVKDIQIPERGSFLYINDTIPDPDSVRARVFDPLYHSFDPIKDIDYRRARDLADLLYTVFPQGESTITVRNGRRALLQILKDNAAKGDEAVRLDKLSVPLPETTPATIEALDLIKDILQSPIVRDVFCRPTNFPFKHSRILAKIDRAKLGRFDALVLGLVLINHFSGQVIVPDFGFYGREAHIDLVAQGRLIAGVNFLDELSPKLRRAVLSIEDRHAHSALYHDAETLAYYEGHRPNPLRKDNDFNNYISDAMASP